MNPSDVVRLTRSAIMDTRTDGVTTAAFPFHHLIDIFEACCHYYQPHDFRPLTHQYLASILNEYDSFDDPTLYHTLKDNGNLLQFLRIMQRQQLDLQIESNSLALSRALSLYASPGLDRLGECFVDRYGLNIEDWLCNYFAASALLEMPRKNSVSYSDFRKVAQLAELETTVDAFLDSACATREQLGERYRRQRWRDGSPQAPRAWSQMRRLLLDTPLVRLPDFIAAPIPALVAELCQGGLYRRVAEACSDAPLAIRELSQSFERYLAGILNLLLPHAIVHGEAELNLGDGVSCDFAIELPDCVWLVECKATFPAYTFVTDNAVLKSGFATTIHDALEQLKTTSEYIISEQCSPRLAAKGRPILATVLTLEMPVGLNASLVSPWMQQNWSSSGVRAIAVDVSTLEHLLLVLHDTGTSLSSLLIEKHPSAETIGHDIRSFIHEMRRAHPGTGSKILSSSAKRITDRFRQ